MTDQIADASLSRTGRIVGASCLKVVVTGMFALFARPALIVGGGDCGEHPGIRRAVQLARTAELVATVCYLGVTAFLCTLFAPVSRTVSVLAVSFGFAGRVPGVKVHCFFPSA